MESAKSLLKISTSPESFINSAESVISQSLETRINNRINQLGRIRKEMGERDFDFTNTEDIPKIYHLFQHGYKKNTLNILFQGKRQIRLLSRSIDYFEEKNGSIIDDIEKLKVAIELIDFYWSPSFIAGIFQAVIKNWDLRKNENIELLRSFLVEKVKDYSGKRKLLNSLKQKIDFFENSNGPSLLGAQLVLENMPISKTSEYLVVPESWLHFNYFSKAIIAYYKKNENQLPEIINDLIEILKIHGRNETDKILISLMINTIKQSGLNSIKNLVKSFAIRKIGDPSIDSNWSKIESASISDNKKIKKAQEILNNWITEEFITVFFEKCINDPRRKKFWLKKADKISDFKIVGSYSMLSYLRMDVRIKSMVKSRYSFVSSAGNNTAIMFVIGDYVLIEFSDSGSIYAYKSEGNYGNLINRNRFNNFGNLKQSQLPQLVYRQGYSITDYNAEGRLPHIDGDLTWEDALDWWMKKFI